MSALALLDDLRRREIFLRAYGGRLVVDAPVGALTDQLRASLAEHKQSLIKLLEWEQRKREEADLRGFAAKRSKEPGRISLHDPLTGQWHDFPAKYCLPSIVPEPSVHHRKGGAA
jgi:TubC N-terminal docking domain